MTGDRFDELARSFAGKWSRRDILGLFGGSLAALLTGTRLARAQVTPDSVSQLTPDEAASVIANLSPQTKSDIATLTQDLNQKNFQQQTNPEYWGSFGDNACATLGRTLFKAPTGTIASLEFLTVAARNHKSPGPQTRPFSGPH